MLTGAIDVLARERGGSTVIVDYKSDALGDRAPGELMRRGYETQRLLYALAGLRDGARAVEVIHLFLERPDATQVASFTAADAPALEQRLLRLAEGPLAGRYDVSSEPRRSLCAGCPAQGGLCSWPLAMTSRESVDRLF
jgi:hypothetical protein